MKYETAIKLMRYALGEIEGEWPLYYSFAFNMAISALEYQAKNDNQSDKYRWHDLLKDPNDLPEFSGQYLVSIGFEDCELSNICDYYRDSKEFKTESIGKVVAWREVDAFDEYYEYLISEEEKSEQ